MKARIAALLALLAAAAAAPGPARAQAPDPPVGHVFTIVASSAGYKRTFGATGRPTYLARTLRRQGALATNYYGTTDAELPNYLTMISGKGSTPLTRSECPAFDCAFGPDVPTLATTLGEAGRTWKGYVEDLPAPCALGAPGAGDPFAEPGRRSQYLTRHNPFAYFESITRDRASCREHVVGLSALRRDLEAAGTTPSFAFIVPDACAGGHVQTCPDPGQPAGADGLGRFLRRWVPRIQRSPAYRADGLLVVLFDEAEDDRSLGGGRTGALLLSPRIRPGSTVRSVLDHYGYLRSVEDLLGLRHLGPDAPTFQDVGAFRR